EPGELFKSDEALFVLNEEPKPMLRDVCNLSVRSAFSKLCGCHPHAPELNEGRRKRAACLSRSSELVQFSVPTRISPLRSLHARAHACEFLREKKNRSEKGLRGRSSGSRREDSTRGLRDAV